MTETVQKLRLELSQLSIQERAELAYFLIHSLDQDVDDNAEFAAKLIGQEKAIPASTSRGVEKFFNGLEFDPENPQAYLNVTKLRQI